MTGSGAIGTVLLLAAVAAALGSTGAASVGLSSPRRSPQWSRVARALLWGAAGLLVAATAVLAVALVGNDWSLAYVADHSRRAIDAPYRLAGLWGGMEGSLLFWTTLLAVVAALGTRRHAPTSCVTLVVAVIVAAFALTTLVVASPFVTLAIPALDGGGLMPILEHPAMLYHPPLLYLALVTLVVPFAQTVAALDETRRDPTALARVEPAVRRWMTISWTLLAIAMLAGANWAYAELGWGGYWAWDPIENSALLPWLAATAYLHARRRPHGGRGALLPAGLAMTAFLLAVTGTLLTRSGAASSVHAFGEAEAVGRALLALTTVLVAGAAAVFARAGHALRDADRPRRAPARRIAVTTDAALLGQVVLVIVVLALVLVGTLAPLLIQLVTGDRSALDGSYFATVTAPLAVLLLLLCALGPRAPVALTAGAIGRELRVPALGALAVVALAALNGWTNPLTLVVGAAAGFAAASVIELAVTRRATIPSSLAHAGFAVLLLGVAGSVATTSATVALGPGATTVVGDVEIRNLGAQTDAGPPPRVVAPVQITRGAASTRLEPSVVGYPERGTVLAETALWATPREDVQVALRRASDDGDVLVQVHVRPLAALVWWGALLIATGGIAALVRLVPRARRDSTPDLTSPPAARTRDRADGRDLEHPAPAGTKTPAATPSASPP